METQQLNYEKDILIDENALDVEWLEQPYLMMRYAKHAALTKRDADLVKERLELVRAEIDKAIRTVPETFGIQKITEAAIQNAILLDERYQSANALRIDADYETNLAQYAVRAIEQRKSALENLVKLHGQQYFAGPHVPRDLSKEYEQHQKQQMADVKVVSAMQRKK